MRTGPLQVVLIATTHPQERVDSREALEQLRVCEAYRDDQGAQACRAALKLGLSSSKALRANRQLGFTLLLLNRCSDALHVYNKILELAPGDSQARFR